MRYKKRFSFFTWIFVCLTLVIICVLSTLGCTMQTEEVTNVWFTQWGIRTDVCVLHQALFVSAIFSISWNESFSTFCFDLDAIKLKFLNSISNFTSRKGFHNGVYALARNFIFIQSKDFKSDTVSFYRGSDMLCTIWVVTIRTKI
jgi:hypothetical protein